MLFRSDIKPKMDFKTEKILTITLNEDAIKKIRDEMTNIDELWVHGQLRDKYWDGFLGQLWRNLK